MQKTIGYISLVNGVMGNTWTKETMGMYEFTSELEAPTLAFAQFNSALQIAQGLMLLGKVLAYASRSAFSTPSELVRPRECSHSLVWSSIHYDCTSSIDLILHLFTVQG